MIVRKYLDQYSRELQIEGIGSNWIILDPKRVDAFHEPNIQCVKLQDEHVYGNNCNNMNSLQDVSTHDQLFEIRTMEGGRSMVVQSGIQHASLFLYALSGQLLQKHSLVLGDNNLSIHGLNSGVYMYRIVGENQQVSGKFICK